MLMRALVVDDSRAMRMILTRILNEVGFEDVLQAGDGSQALAALEEGPLPEVALVDWNMPVMDGLGFINACRANPAYRGITLMMVTTESEQAQIVRALAAGAHEYVMKPFTADAIVDKLALLGLVAV
jgi:two-component system, chemotaxis family, chemotaxis protein CheY